jgi:hypothetical protein
MAHVSALRVRTKTQLVVDHHFDDEKPGKPLHLLIPGAALALVSLSLLIHVAYRTWVDSSLAQGTGMTLVALLAPVYTGGVFLFSYGYELYNMSRALKLTAIIVFITFAVVIIVAVLFSLLEGGGSSSSSSSSKSSSSSDSSGGGARSSILDGLWTSGSVGGSGSSGRVPCTSCKRPYVPAENRFVCPSCGAATAGSGDGA